jgi:hypothetical protein
MLQVGTSLAAKWHPASNWGPVGELEKEAAGYGIADTPLGFFGAATFSYLTLAQGV